MPNFAKYSRFRNFAVIFPLCRAFIEGREFLSRPFSSAFQVSVGVELAAELNFQIELMHGVSEVWHSVRLEFCPLMAL